MKRLKKHSKVPGIDLVPDDLDMNLIINKMPELGSESWIRYTLTGNNQGAQGIFGYWIDENGTPHFYLTELYIFQTAKPINRQYQYHSAIIIHEIDENKNIIKSDVIDAGTSKPMVVNKTLTQTLNLNSSISINLVSKNFQDVLNEVEKRKNDV